MSPPPPPPPPLAVLARALVQAALDKCSVLYFSMVEGPREAHAAYVRLAMRDFAFGLTGAGVGMGMADLVRGLVCSSFVGVAAEEDGSSGSGGGDAAQVEGYLKHWAPLERLSMHASAAASGARSGGGCKSSSSSMGDQHEVALEWLSSMLQAFLAQREAQRAPSEPSAPDASDAAAAAMEHGSLEVKKKRLEGGTAQRMLEQQMRARFMDPGAHMPKFRLFTGLQAVMEAELDDAGMALGDAHAAAILGALFDDMHAFGTHFQRQAQQRAASGMPAPALPERGRERDQRST